MVAKYIKGEAAGMCLAITSGQNLVAAQTLRRSFVF